METIQTTSGSCPVCGKKIPGYNASASYNGSPIRTCAHCQNPYLDRRYHELAAENLPDNELSVSNGLKIFALGLVFLLLSGGFTICTIYFSERYYPKMIIIMVMSVVIMVFGIVDMIRTASGAKLKKLERERAESEQRLMNRDYARQLAELGYNVPDRYL